MFSGGIADKFGNVYEAKWAARIFLDVLRGNATSIRLEGLREEFVGFEFAVQYAGDAVWHQTKINAAQGNWTIAALQREGVLPAVLRRVSASTTDRCVFVSQSAIHPLASLGNKARYSENFEDFSAAIGKDAAEHFLSLVTAMKLSEAKAYELLRRVEFRTLPEGEIDTSIASIAEFLFSTPPTDAFVQLRSFLEQRMNREITTEGARKEIEHATTLRIRDWALVPGLRENVRRETASYLGSYTPFGAAGHAVVRSQVKDIVAHFMAPDGPDVVLLSGVAGSGKSGVVRGVVEELSRAGTTHFAFRVDHVLQSKTPTDFGRALLDRNESPVTTLKGLAPNELSVLIVDQIDAVSEISGRNGAAKNAVLRMVEEARALETVRILLVCRTFDIESDERIKSLQSSKGVAKVDVPLLAWERDVAPVLADLGIDTKPFSDTQKQLLCLPVNLAVYASIAADSGTNFATRKDLFDKLLEKKQRMISALRDGATWAAEAPLSVLAQWMSEHQRLEAPEVTLASFPNALDVLQSEYLIVRSRGAIGFFHESFFDYMFARSFSASSQTLVDLLLSDEQHLFRRTQVRQILEHLRASDTPRYLKELRALLSEPRVRLHIKVAVAQWMATLFEPTASERDLVLELDDPAQPVPLLVRTAIIPSGNWFRTLNEIDWIARQLSSGRPDRTRLILWWLSKAVDEEPAALVKLLESWWADDPERGDQLLDWFSNARPKEGASELVDLVERVIASRPPGLFSDKGDLHRELLFVRWIAEGDPGSSARVLRTYFDAWFALHPRRQPFERDETKGIDMHSMGDLAKRSPIAFLNGTVDAMTRAFSIIAEQEPGQRDYSFTMRVYTGHNYGADEFLKHFRTSLQAVAKSDPETAHTILARINPTLHEAATHLYLETIAANGQAFSSLILPLLASPLIFEAGWYGAKWRSFADAAKAALPHLEPSDQKIVEQVIRAHYPEREFAGQIARELKQGGQEDGWARSRETAMHYLGRAGFEQYCILQAIGAGSLSDEGKGALARLSRKFAHEKPQEPEHFEARVVASPIASEKAARMTDEHWRAAIESYDDDERASLRNFIGGARQLAQVLRGHAKTDPDRFARLLITIPATAHAAYVENILSGIAEADVIDLGPVRQAIAHSHMLPTRPHGQAIAHLFQRHPELADDSESLEILLWYAGNGEANEDDDVEEKRVQQESLTIENLLERSGRIHVRGMNGVRGWAMEALGSVLWRVPKASPRAWEFLEERIQREKVLSVRCCMPRAFTALFNIDRDRTAALFEGLVLPQPARSKTVGAAEFLLFPNDKLPSWARMCFLSIGLWRLRRNSPQEAKWLTPLITHSGTSLLPYIVWNVPDVGRRLIVRLLQSGDPTMRLIATWHVIRASYNMTDYGPLADQLENESLDSRRLAADIAANAAVETELRERAKRKLALYFSYDDKEVQRQASDVFRQVPNEQFNDFADLASRFIMSPAFLHSSFGFLHALEKANANVTEHIALAAERAINELHEPANQRGSHDMEIYQIKDLIRTEYAASEGRPPVRKRLLDIIDAMHQLELSGVEEITKVHER